MRDNLQGLIKMNLQLLAQDTGESEGVKEVEAEGKTYTDDDLAKLVLSGTDKRVTQALSTARANWEKEYQEKLEQEKTEAEKLAKMNAQQKAEFEIDSDIKEL